MRNLLLQKTECAISALKQRDFRVLPIRIREAKAFFRCTIDDCVDALKRLCELQLNRLSFCTAATRQMKMNRRLVLMVNE